MPLDEKETTTNNDDDEDDGLVPIHRQQPIPFLSRIIGGIKSILLIPIGIIGGCILLLLFIVVTITGIGPLIEYYLSKRDKEAIDRNTMILKQHPEMFLLEIPSNINKASLGQSYKIMVRLTKPSSSSDSGSTNNYHHQNLPPVIMPGGLASNLMTMSKHQNELTSKYGFIVVNFDRLGVGLSDPYPQARKQQQQQQQPPSAADVAREMNFVMDYCEKNNLVVFDDGNATYNDDDNDKEDHHHNEEEEENYDGNDSERRRQQRRRRRKIKWIQVGGSMGTNVATAFVALYPGRLCGFLNLDGLPHAFLQIQCKKFLKDGNAIMTILKNIRWTGLPRFIFSMALQQVLPAMDTSIFTPQQLLAVMCCSNQFFVTTGLEYTTLMSCCDLEVAAWGRSHATTSYDKKTLRIMSSLAPDESVIVNDVEGISRQITNERSESELGINYLSKDDPKIVEFLDKFRELALKSPDEIDRKTTHCNWPEIEPRPHPVGEYVGGVDVNTIIYPLANEFQNMVVRVMCARDYKGLERDYTQEARNHAAARTSLHCLTCHDSKSYYYPRLSHLNLWQQSSEITDITYEIAMKCIPSSTTKK